MKIIPNNSKLLQILKVSQFLRFSEVTRKPEHFLAPNLTDVIKRFCDVTKMTCAFYDSVSKKAYVQNLNRL